MDSEQKLLHRMEVLEAAFDAQGKNLQELAHENLLLRRRSEALGKSVLEGEEERGRMLASLASSARQANELQLQRMNLSVQRDELHEARFDYVQQVLETLDQRVKDLEILEGSGDRYSITGLRKLAEVNTQVKASMAPPPPPPEGVVKEPAPPPAKAPPSMFPMGKHPIWVTVAALATALATGFTIAYKLLFPQ